MHCPHRRPKTHSGDSEPQKKGSDMNETISNFPAKGSTITCKEALDAYDELEYRLAGKVFSNALSHFANVRDVELAIASIAERLDEERDPRIDGLRRELGTFAVERTALANGKDGERFRLLPDEDALELYDETHMFEVGIDAEAIEASLDAAIDLIMEQETDQFDEYSRVYAPCSHLSSRTSKSGAVPKWIVAGIVAMTCAIGASAMAISIFNMMICFSVIG